MNCKSSVTRPLVLLVVLYVAESVSKGWAKLRAVIIIISIIFVTMTRRWDDGTSYCCILILPPSKKNVVLDFCATSLTRFVENICNIYISK